MYNHDHCSTYSLVNPSRTILMINHDDDDDDDDGGDDGDDDDGDGDGDGDDDDGDDDEDDDDDDNEEEEDDDDDDGDGDGEFHMLEKSSVQSDFPTVAGFIHHTISYLIFVPELTLFFCWRM